MLLATTAIEEYWGADEKILFLGDWCRVYERKELWMARDHLMVRNHWDDRSKLRSDHDYLQKLHNALLRAIATSLNEQHKIQRPFRFWQTILDPWLLTYVAVIWDRWECLRVAFEEHGQLDTISFGEMSTKSNLLDYSDFVDKSLGDTWNHQKFLDIIGFQYTNQCQVRISPSRIPIQSKLSEELHFLPRQKSLKYKLTTMVDTLAGKLLPSNKVVIFDSYFSFSDLVKLNLRLRQFPRLYRGDFEPIYRQEKEGARIRDRNFLHGSLASALSPETAFETFLFKTIAEDIPFVHVEGFSQLLSKAPDIRLTPRAVFTANAHYANELFKLWVAERNFQGEKYVTMEHGSSLPPAFNTMSFEEDSADVKTTWARPYHVKHRQMPPNKRLPMNIKSTGDVLAVLGYEMPRYHFRADATPKSSQIHVHLAMIESLYSSVEADVQSHLKIRPYPNCGWNTRQRLIDKLGEKTISNEPDYRRFLSQAKLIVCTYPQTTFSEAIATGIPTILLYPPQLWETISQFHPLIESMRAAKLVFHDPALAAIHINEIWHSPMAWWNDTETRLVLDVFLNSALNLGGDRIDQWADFMKSMAR